MVVKKYKYLVGGGWKGAGEAFEVRNPFDDSIVGIIYKPTKDDIEEAARLSVEGFEQTRNLPAYKRAEILANIKNGIEKRKRELAETITLESGKPLKYSLVETERSINVFQIASEEAKRIGGEMLPLDILKGLEGMFGINKPFPLGPVLGITPFNFPLNLVSHKVAPALATGNSIIIKPASRTPLTALLLAEIVMESGLPKGAFSVLPMSATLAEQMVSDERLKMVSFTGSSSVGWHLRGIAGKKKVTLELGGNAGAIVNNDADIEHAVDRCCYGGYVFSGQTCISLQRLFVHEEVYDDFVQRFVVRIRDLRVGNPMDQNTEIGPMIDLTAAEQAEERIRKAVAGGARILTGGGRKASVLEPTLLADTTPDMEVNCKEVFAPIVTIRRFSSFPEAVDMVNDPIYGLQAGIFTKNIEYVFMAYNRLNVGGVIVNNVPTFRVDSMPYGGIKGSGMAREGVKYAMEEMSEHKLLVLRS